MKLIKLSSYIISRTNCLTFTCLVFIFKFVLKSFAVYFSCFSSSLSVTEMSFDSKDSEISFDSKDSEISYIAEVETDRREWRVTLINIVNLKRGRLISIICWRHSGWCRMNSQIPERSGCWERTWTMQA